MAAAELAAELPALVLFFVTGIVGYLVAKWFGQRFVVPRKPLTKIAKLGNVSDRDDADSEHTASDAKGTKSGSQKAKLRARRSQRRSRSSVSEMGFEEASRAEPASLIHESIDTASTQDRIAISSLAKGRAGTEAAKKERRSKQRSATMTEVEEEKDEAQTWNGLPDTASLQQSTPLENDSKLGTESPTSTTAESGSDAHPFDSKTSDVTEEIDNPECSVAHMAKSEGYNAQPCEPITAALQKLQQRLSEASEIRGRVEGSAQVRLSSPASEGMLIREQSAHGAHMDDQQSDSIPESRQAYRIGNDEENSDEDDARYDEALRAVLEKAQGATWQSPDGFAMPTYSLVPGDAAWASQQAPWALSTGQVAGAVCPGQHDIGTQGALRGTRPSAQPLVPCARNPGLYTNGQQVFHPVYVKVDPDADSVLDPRTHAVVESDDPEYGAYLNYINSCQSVVVMAEAPSCGGACPQLALVPNTPHARMRNQSSGGGLPLKHQRCSHGGDLWNMSWEKAPSQW